MTKFIIAVLLSAALLLNLHGTPVHKSFADTASVPRTTVVAKPSTAPTTSQVQPVKETAQAVSTPPVPTTHDELMAAAGIQPADYGAADYIISHESSWDVNATEPTSGAHGLPQALPYAKTGCGWVDAVCQLSWANQYAISRYGGWWPAQAYWAVHLNW